MPYSVPHLRYIIYNRRTLTTRTKKSALVILFFCLFTAPGICQFSHKFGNFTPAEVKMKECSFDPEAAAVVLIDEAFANYDNDYKLITLNHRRLKILRKRGIENADVSIPFYSEDGFEYIDNIQARTINIDENGNRKEYPIDPKSIYSKKVNKYYSEMKFAFPEVKVGSILEYSYRSVKKHYGGLEGWDFQERLPVYFSSFELIPAPNLEFTYKVQKSPRYPVVVKRSDFTHSIYFEMDSLPGLSDEPYMDSREDYVQKVSFTITKFAGMTAALKYMNSWNDVARELWGDSGFGGEIRAKVRTLQDTIADAIAGKTPFGKTRYIYNFVRKNIQWNGLYSKYAYEGVRSAWSKRSGNSGCINLLLVNLLRSADLDAYPLLVSERGNGKIDTATPFLSQFNNVYAAVAIDGKNYYLDATDMYTPAYIIPYSILNTTALLVKNKTGKLINIEEHQIKYRENIYINAELSDEGNLTAVVRSMSKDYARREKIKNYNAGKDKYIENYIKHDLVNVSIDSLEISGDLNDSADFVQKFNMKTHAQSTGDYTFLGLNFFTGFETDPFISDQRFSNINLGYESAVELNWVIKIPQKWTVDALPRNLKMVNPDKSIVFSREIVYNQQASRIIARIRIGLNKSLYSVDEYPVLKEFFKKMVDMLNEQVVLKSK